MDVSGGQWMPDKAHPAKHKAILWHHASSTQRIERVELVNHQSQSESAAASLKMIVDSVEAIARDKVSETEPAGGSKASLRHLLNQLSISEVKAVHFIVQSGRTPSWLRDSSSIESLYLDLNGVESEERNRQVYVDFLVSKIDRLPAYIASYSEICGERHLDPFDELGALVQEERAHSRSSG
ncbi:hypothetical protein [uncultured Marinobacter sp.]|uniref:hypothetical protein n=1 Tax=uncultured Marinobacter sp. TaxID=187379 RepID=UPI0026283110|nr:hypothetical protein [uncultured Marinobacter sp.]